MRQLRVVSDETVLGTVDYVDGRLVFTGVAGEVFAGLRRVLGDQELGPDLVEHGWSNGYLYLGPWTNEDAAMPGGNVVEL